MLDDTIKARWVDALRSGEFKQGGGGLKQARWEDAATHCCLGVLCEIVAEEKGYDWTTRGGVNFFYKADTDPERYDGESHHGFVPPTLADELGISQEQQTFLARLNDSGNLSFPQIAEVVSALPLLEAA